MAHDELPEALREQLLNSEPEPVTVEFKESTFELQEVSDGVKITPEDGDSMTFTHEELLALANAFQ